MPKKKGRSSIPMTDPGGYLSKRQVDSIINEGSKSKRDKVLLTTLWMSGRRVSEVVGLREQIKKDGKYIYRPVVGGLKPSDILEDRNAIIWNVLKKGQPVRKVKGIPSSLKRMLLSYIDDYNIQNDKLVFPITRQRVHQILKRAGNDVGISKIGDKLLHPHHLRHSYAVYMIDRIQLKKLQELLDHSDINMTIHYLQYSTKDIEKDVEEAWK